MHYGLDIESDWNDAYTETWIAQIAIVSDTEVMSSNDNGDIPGFLARMFSETPTSRPSYVWIHNLDFDLNFLFPYFAETDKIEVIARRGRIISATVSRDHHTLRFRDTSKKYQGRLKDLAPLVGLAKLEPPSEFRAGWSATPRPLDYVIEDATITRALGMAAYGAGLRSATFSGDAWNAIKDTIGRKRFDRLFPSMSSRMDSYLRQAYFGGINISSPGYYVGEDIKHIDIHSMYPSVMREGYMPIGLPWVSKHAESDLWVCTFEISDLQIKDGRQPWFTFKTVYDNAIEDLHMGDPVDYCTRTHELTLCSVDFMQLKEDYDFSYEIVGEFLNFEGEYNLFNEYIEKWFSVKNNSPKGSIEYARAKLMLNSMYGRFGISPEKEVYKVIGGELQKIDEVTEDRSSGYIPVALFTTAYARAKLLKGIRWVRAHGGTVIHSDTDSIIYTGCSEDVPTGDELGMWGLESEPKAIYEIAPKKYIEYLSEAVACLDDVKVAMSGVPQGEEDGVPYGMWLEVLDHPERISPGVRLGSPDYHIDSPWLKDLTGRDTADTRRLVSSKATGGRVLIPSSYVIRDDYSIRLHR